SDYPNQVNNVLGFPFIFRGALDVEASTINEEMKKAVAYALADLARQDVPDSVKRAYRDTELSYGPEYIIPKPFDHRVLVSAAVAVARAAIETGVARQPVDPDAYRDALMERMDPSRDFMRKFHILARKDPKRVVFPEGTHPAILEAAGDIVREGVAKPVLLARNAGEVGRMLEERGLAREGLEIIEPKSAPFRDTLVDHYYRLRQRKGVSRRQAELHMRNYFFFGTMMVKHGIADAVLAGVSVNFPEVLRPALQIIGPRQGGSLAAGMYFVVHEHKMYCLADCAVNINPSAAELSEITLLAASELDRLHIEPRVAMLSFSNFGSVRTNETTKITQAIELVRSARPQMPVDGPVQADIALDPFTLKEHFPFADLKQRPNLLIFPNLDAGNISLKLLRTFSSAHQTGPIMVGMDKPIQLLTRQMHTSQIVDLAAIATVDAQVMPA
ncbi:MAG: phosphate acyltransferase, partial [Saprospiraceae bacterium]|nr:phosphate acyltransferase [Saprospiraceae bacterium]